MKSNQTLFLGVIAALGILAAYLWVSKPGGSPQPAVGAAKSSTPAKRDDAPVAPPAPPKQANEPMQAKVALPVNPTQTGELPPMREGRAFYGRIDTLEQVGKLLDAAVAATGGEAVEKTLLAAKWRLIVTMPARALFVEMQTDAEGGLYAKDEQLGTEWFLVHDECRIRQGKLVAACLKEQAEFIHGLFLGQLSAVPLRLKGYHIVTDNVTDTKDIVYVQLPTVAEHVPVRLQISRENATVIRALWSDVTVSPERNRLDEDWGTPNAWSMDASPLTPESKDKAVVKRDLKNLTWQGAVRVVELKPNKDKTPLKLPELTGPQPLSVISRPAMSVVVVPLVGHGKVEDAKVKIMNALRFEGLLDLTVFEMFAPADKAPHLAQGVELWIALPPQAIAVQAQKHAAKEIAAEAKVARKIVRGAWSDLPDQLVKFVGEVNAAGHHPGPGPTLVRLVSVDDGDSLLVELQVPLAGK